MCFGGFNKFLIYDFKIPELFNPNLERIIKNKLKFFMTN